MKYSLRTFLQFSLVLLISTVCQGAEIIGMNRDQVVENFGAPKSALGGSSREILNYSQGQIIMVQGKVSSFKGTFIVNVEPIQEPVERAATVVQKTVSEPSSGPDMSRRSVEPFWWSTTLADAQARSKKKNGLPILALFTGPDWCAPCQQLEAQVLNTTKFKILGRKQFIPLKIALYMNNPQTAQAKAEYYKLSKEYAINGVPSFAILTTDGTLLSKPDLNKRRPGVSSYSEQVIAAITDADNSTKGKSLYMKVGIGVVLSAILVIFLRR